MSKAYTPKFQPADLIKDQEETLARVLSVDYLTKKYELEIVAAPQTGLMAGLKTTSECILIDACCTLCPRLATLARVESIQPAEVKPCTCDSLELSRKGCQCGAIAKRKWGLG